VTKRMAPANNVKTIVVIYAENRGFDNLYGLFPGANGIPGVNPTSTGTAVAQNDFDGSVLPTLPPTWGGVTAAGQSVTITPASTANMPNQMFHIDSPSGFGSTGTVVGQNGITRDLWHRFYQNQMQFNGGKNDKFAAFADAGGLTMGYYDGADLPFYYGLYNTFAIGDRYCASVLGPTFPNRFYLLAGTSFGHIRNDFPDPTGFSQPTVFNRLDAAHVSWRIYYSQLPFAGLFAYVRNHAPGNVVPISQYYADAAAGSLPQVSFVDPVFAATNTVENDEHPPSDVQVGQNFAAQVINSLFKSPNWSSSALFLTYDEHGGFYDHAAPPSAPIPDAIPPMLQPGDAPGAFDRYGIRVPVAVVSPFARPHFVSHVVHDHTSILRFIERRFDLPALSRRDAKADPMLEFFDFKRPSFPNPPQLPAAPVNPAQLAACALMPSNSAF